MRHVIPTHRRTNDTIIVEQMFIIYIALSYFINSLSGTKSHDSFFVPSVLQTVFSDFLPFSLSFGLIPYTPRFSLSVSDENTYSLGMR